MSWVSLGGSPTNEMAAWPWMVRIHQLLPGMQGAPHQFDAASGFLVSPWWVITARHVVDATAGALDLLRGFAMDSSSYAATLELPPFDSVILGNGDIAALHLSAPWAPGGMTFPAIQWSTSIQNPVVFGGFGPAENELLFRASIDNAVIQQVDGDYPGQKYWSIQLPNCVIDPGLAGGPVAVSSPGDGQRIFGVLSGMITADQKAATYTAMGADGYELQFQTTLLRMPVGVLMVGRTVTWETLASQTNARPLGPDVSGYRVFAKYASDGDTWAKAITVDVAGANTMLALLNNVQDDSQLWKVTVLPVMNGNVLGAGPDGRPPPGDRGGCTAWATYAYQFPANLQAVSVGDSAIKLSWASVAYVENHPDISRYKIFSKYSSDGATWSKALVTYADPDATSTVLYPMDQNQSWTFTILPMVGDTVIGAGTDGRPFDGQQSNVVTTHSPPVLVYQFPNPNAVLPVPAGAVGAGLISARFARSSGTTYEWEWASTFDGAYSSAGDWSHISGQGTPSLQFGSGSAPSRPADSGWYRLKATNALGTTYTTPVHVTIQDFKAPALIWQTPHAGAAINAFMGNSGFPFLSAQFACFTNGPPSYVWETSASQYGAYSSGGDWSRLSGQTTNTLTFGNGNNTPTTADSGWYRLRATDFNGNVGFSEPVQVQVVSQYGYTPPKIGDQHPASSEQLIVPSRQSSYRGDSWPAALYAATNTIGVHSWWKQDRLGNSQAATISNSAFAYQFSNPIPADTGWYFYKVSVLEIGDSQAQSQLVRAVVIDGDGTPQVLSQSAATVRGRAGRAGTASVVYAFSNMYGVPSCYGLGSIDAYKEDAQASSPASDGPAETHAASGAGQGKWRIQAAGGMVFLSFGLPGYPASTDQSGTYVLYVSNQYGAITSSPVKVVIDPEGLSDWGASNLTVSELAGAGSSGTLSFAPWNGSKAAGVLATGTFTRKITLPAGLVVARPFLWDPWDGGGGEPQATVDENGAVVTVWGMSYYGLVTTYPDTGTTVITLSLTIPDAEQDSWPGSYDYSRAKAVNIPVVVLDTSAYDSPVVVEWEVPPGVRSTNPLQTSVSYYLPVPAFTPPSPPRITHITPTSGPPGGGTQATITGSNLSNTKEVDFGGVPGTYLTVQDDSHVLVVVPSNTVGTTVDVTVQATNGSATLPKGYTYTQQNTQPQITGVSPSQGPSSGGTRVTITGVNLLKTVEVDFGDVPGFTAPPGTDLKVIDDQHVQVTTPPHASGPVTVWLMVSQYVTLPNGFTYQ